MKGLVKLILLAAAAFLIFFVSNPLLFAAFALAVIILMIAGRINPFRVFRSLSRMLPFIVFASLVNLLLGDLREMILVCARLVLVCGMTFMFRERTGSMELAKAVTLLFYPVKLFRAKPEDIGLMVCIAVAFIPVLQRELREIRRALMAKGMKWSLHGVKYVLQPLLAGVLKRTGEIATALRAKAYE
ncbi:MAG: hypothetical protein LBC88_06160 [Spirochaetaceae bacterium]|nr:hypothetical protein [Spirochaetaceae bacterium]